MCSGHAGSLQCRGYEPVENCAGAAGACVRRCAGDGVPAIQHSNSGMDRARYPDCCGDWRESAICHIAGIAAGRGILRAEPAVVLQRHAAIRASTRSAGGGSICAGHPGDVHFSCGIRRNHCVDRKKFVWIGLLRSAFFLGCLEFASMYMPAIGFPWNLLGYVAAGNMAFVQITAVTGIFGLSFLVAAYSSLVGMDISSILVQ